MYLTEENHEYFINSCPKNQWQPLFSLIPELEAIIDEINPLSRDLTYDEQLFRAQIKFQNTIEEIPIVFSFDWPAWEEGRRMVSDPRFDFNSVDVPTKCKVLIALNRSDHFCDGALRDNIESGLLLRILKSIRDQVEHNT
ncbi:MAG: DUF6508 domain-containing protein [Pedobacter sp.]|nr:DUF6508 domain-containing protein [Pedobacter sp.]